MCPYGGAPICPRPDLAQFKALIGATDQIAVMVDIEANSKAPWIPTSSTTSASPSGAPQPPRPERSKCKKKRAAAARSARRSGARRSEADQRRIDGAVPPALVDGLADRQVLDRQAGRVEERDLVGRVPASAAAGQDVTELGHVLCASPVRHRPRWRARRPRSPAPTRRRRGGSARSPSRSTSCLPCASAPSTARCWPGRRSRIEDHRLLARRHRDHDVLGGGLGHGRRPASRARRASASAGSTRGSAQTPGP